MRIGELSRRVGIPSDTLRVWERRYGLLAPRRTSGNARLYSAVDEARVRLMRRYINQRISPAQAAELSLAARFSLRPGGQPGAQPADVARVGERLRSALDAFDETAADQALDQLIGDYSPIVVLRHVLLPYLHDLGERWASGETSVAQEHFASSYVLFRLGALARGWDRGLGPRALLACAPDEQHTIALICFGIALHQHGWRISFLGASTPVETLEGAAEHLRPDLITVCGYRRRVLEPQLGKLRRLGERWQLALAGPAAQAELAADCNAQHLDEDPIGAAARVALVA